MNYLAWGVDWICRIYALTAEDQSYLYACADIAKPSDRTEKSTPSEKALSDDRAFCQPNWNDRIEPDIRMR